jgi:hypothetical protein
MASASTGPGAASKATTHPRKFKDLQRHKNVESTEVFLHLEERHMLVPLIVAGGAYAASTVVGRAAASLLVASEVLGSRAEISRLKKEQFLGFNTVHATRFKLSMDLQVVTLDKYQGLEAWAGTYLLTERETSTLLDAMGLCHKIQSKQQAPTSVRPEDVLEEMKHYSGLRLKDKGIRKQLCAGPDGAEVAKLLEQA